MKPGFSLHPQSGSVRVVLNERQRRLYAAAEAVKLGRGGVTYLSRLFDCDRKTIYRGLEELGQPSLPLHQARKKGGAAVAV